MSTTTLTVDDRAEIAAQKLVPAFAGAMLLCAVAACLLAGWTPIGFSIATVFLFAGPHNWLEARYMLTCMPARWCSLWWYFSLGIGGVLLLTAVFASLPFVLEAWGAGQETWLTAVAGWNTLLLVWVLGLIHLRSRQNPRRDWSWTLPVGLLLMAANWLWPASWSLGLVYLHPLVALWFLDRELSTRRPEWLRTYRLCLCSVPLLVAALWWRLAASPNLPGQDLLTLQITGHAGAGVLSGISTHCLVATHTFLEMLHYAVWIVAIPLVSVRMLPWQLENVPLAKKSPRWRTAVLAAIALGVLVMVVLWGGFVANYPLTRDIYFTVAMLHVLAEVPFLLRLL